MSQTPRILYLTPHTERFTRLFQFADLISVPPPQALWIEHRDPDALSLLERTHERGLAIVGTRDPQLRTCELIRREVRKLHGRDLIILSGFARGIDACAHEAALEADLPTIAILGCGLSYPYLREHASLRQRILEKGGLIVSEFPLDERPHPSNFLQRNRLIAGWAKATLVAEARVPSGALSTAGWAQKMDRACFVVPTFPDDIAYAGNRKLIDDHHARIFWGAHSLGQEWLGLATVQDAPRRKFDSRLFSKIARETELYGGSTLESLQRSFRGNSAKFWGELESLIVEGKVIEQGGKLKVTLMPD